MKTPVGLHGTGVVTHKHRLANTIRGLMWIRFRRYTSLHPGLREQLIVKLEELLPVMHKAMCETCGWRGPCRHVKRMAENDALAHVIERGPDPLLRAFSQPEFKEQLRLSFSDPDPTTTAVPVVPHREANESDRYPTQ